MARTTETAMSPIIRHIDHAKVIAERIARPEFAGTNPSRREIKAFAVTLREQMEAWLLIYADDDTTIDDVIAVTMAKADRIMRLWFGTAE
jgi:hypothetical protein